MHRLINKTRKKGVSLRASYIIMLILSVAVAAALLIVSFLAFRSYNALSDATDTYIRMHSVADSLMTASDYLTEEVQCYTVLGDRKHLENYFTESEKTRRRENAVASMERDLPDTAALEDLQIAMKESLSLMDREYYAMALILSAQNDPDVPPALSGVTLREADAALYRVKQDGRRGCCFYKPGMEQS